MPEIGTSTAARATDTGDYEDDQTAPPASQEEGHQVQVEANQMQRTHANAHAQMHTCTTLHAYTLLETNEYTHALTHRLTHTHTHTHTHSHTHTYAHTLYPHSQYQQGTCILDLEPLPEPEGLLQEHHQQHQRFHQ
jgi:hypothetical protein